MTNNNQNRRLHDRKDCLEHYDDDKFFKLFRFSNANFYRVLEIFEEVLMPKCGWSKALQLCALRFYASGQFLNSTGDMINVHKSTASHVIHRVSDALTRDAVQHSTKVSPSSHSWGHRLHSCENSCERAFGVLKRRFHCLHSEIRFPNPVHTCRVIAALQSLFHGALVSTILHITSFM